MNLPKEYVDNTFGVRPGPNEASFNNIVYTTWWAIIMMFKGTMTQSDLDSVIAHITLNEDENNLYAPKNSHDNVTYKLILSEVFHLEKHKDMGFFPAIFQIGIYRIWDVITYGAIFAPKLLRPFFQIFLFIPALQMIESVAFPDKIRPKWFGDGKISRIKWWFKKRTLIKEESDNTTVTKHWELSDGTIMTSRHMSNDGTHLAIFRLFAFQDKFYAFKLAAKICRYLLTKRYGHDYTHEVIKRYFRDEKHPVTKLWKGYGDIL